MGFHTSNPDKNPTTFFSSVYFVSPKCEKNAQVKRENHDAGSSKWDVRYGKSQIK